MSELLSQSQKEQRIGGRSRQFICRASPAPSAQCARRQVTPNLSVCLGLQEQQDIYSPELEEMGTEQWNMQWHCLTRAGRQPCQCLSKSAPDNAGGTWEGHSSPWGCSGSFPPRRISLSSPRFVEGAHTSSLFRGKLPVPKPFSAIGL